MDGAWTRCDSCRRKLPVPPVSTSVAAHDIDNNVLKVQAMHHAARMEGSMGKLQCVVCQKGKLEHEFHESTWKNRNREHRRCRACFTCPTCAPGTKHTLADFVHGSKICRTCARTLTCVVCKRPKLKTEYPDSVWRHQKERKHHRCRAFLSCLDARPVKYTLWTILRLARPIANAATR